MDPAELAVQMERWGSVVPKSLITTHLGAHRFREAVQTGELVRLSRGLYAIPETDATIKTAGELHGTVILLSAALHWGWAIQKKPIRPQIAVGLGRKVPVTVRRRIDIRWRYMPTKDRWDWVTTPNRTVLDCAALLPFDEALCVADSALRSGRVSIDGLLGRVPGLPRQHRRRVENVIRSADGLAANPFESTLRALCLDVGLKATPQVSISDHRGFVGRVDLAEEQLRLVLEADSHEFHTAKDAFAKDCFRYSRLTLADWTVLRFPWGQVMHDQEQVRSLLREGVALCEARLAAGRWPSTTRSRSA